MKEGVDKQELDQDLDAIIPTPIALNETTGNPNAYLDIFIGGANAGIILHYYSGRIIINLKRDVVPKTVASRFYFYY